MMVVGGFCFEDEGMKKKKKEEEERVELSFLPLSHVFFFF
jgi:hypothetical protein